MLENFCFTIASTLDLISERVWHLLNGVALEDCKIFLIHLKYFWLT